MYCGSVEASDVLRYGSHSKALPSHLLQFSMDKRPVVVWNVTQRCNLKCAHCYADATAKATTNELSYLEAKDLLEDLAQFGTPVVLFSGGEPFLRSDLTELVQYAVRLGMRAVISSNGTLISAKKARELKEAGVSYIGISLDGLEATHDEFRGVPGSFGDALRGIALAQGAGIKVGLRLTINRANVDQIPALFALMREQKIPRVCFYHMVAAGRGHSLGETTLSHTETRKAVDTVIDLTRQAHADGYPLEVLTVDNHADGPYLYLRLLRENPARAAEVLTLLQMNGGNSSGLGIGCVSWDGTVYPDQFWRSQPLGNVRERMFSEIWHDLTHPLLGKLKEKKRHVTGRCVKCRWLDVCGGNLRARAHAATDDIWGEDPACYLTDDEISQAGKMKKYLFPVGLLTVFTLVAVVLWLTLDNLFYLFNFMYIGVCVSLGVLLYLKRYRYARRQVQFGVGLYMLLYLGVISRENMQLEGFWYYLFLGVFAVAVIHYLIAKIAGPLLFGRGWCGYACWTAMVLDVPPYKTVQTPVNGALRRLRYPMFILSLLFVAG